jgi:branched-chain amino acid transport system permease protein
MIQQALGGLVAGGAYALIAVCLVLMYQMVGVLNFAQSALGALAACTSLFALNKLHWGPWPATVLAVACGAVVSGVVGLVMARFFLETSVVTRSTVTIAFLVGVTAVGNHILNGATYTFPSTLAGNSVSLFGTGVPIGSLVEAGGAIVLAVLVTLLLNRTHLGAQLRAMSDRPTTAQLLGIRVRRLTVLVWAFTGAVSTVAVMFVLPTSTTSFPPLAYLSMFALGAALLGLLQNMVVAAVGGIAIGMLESIILPSSLGRYDQAVPFLLIIVIMIWWRRRDVWSEAR